MTELSRDEKCERCGTCLARCPVLHLDERSAAADMEALAGGRWVGEVLDRCTGCMTCDSLCPHEAHPYGLLLARYAERYRDSGIPRVFMNAMPQRDGPNLWRGIERWLSPAEKADLASWSRPQEGDEVLFLGCNQRLTPYIADTALFDGLEIFTDPGQCCGEFFLRLGLFDEARARAASLARRFSELGVKRVIAFCPACQNTIEHLAPEYLGVRFEVEVTGLVEWLARGLELGDISPRHVLKGRVTVQDPCHASGLGAQPVDAVRSLLAGLGLDVVEMGTCGMEAECCGLGASLARYRLTDVARVALRRARQAHRTGAELTCAWCNGCYMVMNMARFLYPLQPPVYHLVELLQLATGEQPVGRQPARSAHLFAAAVEAATRDGFRFGRVRL